VKRALSSVIILVSLLSTANASTVVFRVVDSAGRELSYRVAKFSRSGRNSNDQTKQFNGGLVGSGLDEGYYQYELEPTARENDPVRRDFVRNCRPTCVISGSVNLSGPSAALVLYGNEEDRVSYTVSRIRASGSVSGVQKAKLLWIRLQPVYRSDTYRRDALVDSDGRFEVDLGAPGGSYIVMVFDQAELLYVGPFTNGASIALIEK
jgi:hypothetical protein